MNAKIIINLKLPTMKKLHQCPDCGAIYVKEIETKQCFWQELDCFELTALEVLQESEPLQILTGLFKVIKTFYCTTCEDLRNPQINLN